MLLVRRASKMLVAEADNFAMLKVFEKSGLHLSAKQQDGVVHIVLRL
jgi:hypothetical protein